MPYPWEEFEKGLKEVANKFPEMKQQVESTLLAYDTARQESLEELKARQKEKRKERGSNES